jgi:hypothetical protein
MFRGAEQFGIGKPLAGLRKLMAELRAVGGEVIKPGQDQETGQACVYSVPSRIW